MGKDLKGRELGVGLYQRKDGRYEAKATISGVKIDIYGTNLQKLKIEFNKAKEEAKQGFSVKFKNADLDEWFEFWFDTYKAPTVKKQSIRPMKNKYKNTFGKYIGKYKIRSIKNMDVQLALNQLRQTSIATSSIREALGRVTTCLESARNNGLIQANPCFDIIVPWARKEPERRFLTPEEQNTFLEETKGSWYEEMFFVMFCTGLRIGEVGGLKWEDVDFQNKCFHLNQALCCQYEEGKKMLEFTELKTPNSYRTIPFMGGVEEKLKAWSKKQSKERLRLGKRWRCPKELDGIVFTTSLGSPVTRYIGEKEVNKVVKAINTREAFDSVREGREPVEFAHTYPHAIRHTFCSRCFELGIAPKVVQGLMGHAHYSTTIDIYTHVMGTTVEGEAEKFGQSIIEDNAKLILTKAKIS